MSQARWLLLTSQAVLWLQLLVQGQLQLLVALALPGLMFLQLWRPRQRLPSVSMRLITLSFLFFWVAGLTLAPGSFLQGVSNLLWLLIGLQQLEARRHEQHQRSVLMLLLGTGLAGLGAQGLAASLSQGLTALVALAGLHSLETGDQRMLTSLRRIAVLLVTALPLLLASFLLLPRLEPIWNLPVSARSARSGLTNQLAPGEIASLVLDQSLAARVSFKGGGPPAREQRYWRVLVHQRFDGRKWSAVDDPPRPKVQGEFASGPANQSWIVEPSRLLERPWDGRSLPQAGSPLVVSELGTLQNLRVQSDRQLYKLTDGTRSVSWQSAPPRAIDSQLIGNSNPRLQNLGRQWARQASKPEQRLALAREWFQGQDFAYSLKPGELGSTNPLDRFLFETRTGFCEHYAASFSALMRAAGVPSRVVVGYQGGDWQQPLGGSGFLQLKNSDAHAWSEVWLPDQGWIRIDPTAWVTPERIRRSLAASLSKEEQEELIKSTPSWLQGVLTQWDGLDYNWQLTVMGFDRQRQVALLGQSRWQGLTAVVAMGVALLAGLMAVRKPWQSTGDAARKCLDTVLRQLDKYGYSPYPGETLVCFFRRVGSTEEKLASILSELAQSYSRLRFAPSNQVESPSSLRLEMQKHTKHLKDSLRNGAIAAGPVRNNRMM